MVESFHEILNEVSSKGTEMNSSEVKVALQKMGGLFDDMVAKVQVFGSENKDKRLNNETLAKDNRELKAQIDSLSSQVNSLDDSALKAEIQTLKDKEQKWTESARSNLQKKLDNYTSHSNWDKAKSFLDVSQNDDGKIDLTGLDPDAIANMTESVSKVEKLGLFESSMGTPSSPTFGKGTPKVEPNGGAPDDLSDREQVSKFVSKELQKAL
jgi:cell division protein FtsB